MPVLCTVAGIAGRPETRLAQAINRLQPLFKAGAPELTACARVYDERVFQAVITAQTNPVAMRASIALYPHNGAARDPTGLYFSCDIHVRHGYH